MSKQSILLAIKNPQNQDSNSRRNNFNYLQKLKNIENVNRQIALRVAQILPQINSPYLKKAVQSLFQKKKDIKRSPAYPKSEQKLFTISKLLSKQTYQSKKYQKIFNTKQITFDKKQIPISYLSTKLVKNPRYSQDIQKSQIGKPTVKILRSKIINKIMTETSQQSPHESQYILQKFEQINKKEFVQRIINNKFQTPVLKKIKPSINIVKQKLTQQLYSDQRQQIKLVKMHLSNNKHLDISRNLTVKNYVNFSPNVISIDAL